MAEEKPEAKLPHGLDPSVLEGTRRKRVFVGGSYDKQWRDQLNLLVAVVKESGFVPVIADWYKLENDSDIHDDTLALLHSCRLAIFEVSVASGALMEIERAPDYGIRALVLFSNPDGKSHLPSRMLSTFLENRGPYVSFKGYASPEEALKAIRLWLKDEEEVVG